VSAPEDVPPARRVPPLLWIGLFFVVLAFATDDVRALYVGGGALVIASLQWGRPRS
jgi:hypothetical protein